MLKKHGDTIERALTCKKHVNCKVLPWSFFTCYLSFWQKKLGDVCGVLGMIKEVRMLTLLVDDKKKCKCQN